MRPRSLPIWMLSLAVWMAGSIAGTAWLVTRFVARVHTGSQTALDQAHLVIRQRLDQNEALLEGLSALLRSSRSGGFPALRQCADAMLARYPHLYTIGYQPRVAQAERITFERDMSERLGRRFRIRDFSFEGDRAWRVAPQRAFHFPVTFMAPALNEALDVIGYDVYSDAATRVAIERSAVSGQAIAAPPFDLVEGGRGYIFLRALQLPDNGGHTGTVTPNHLISLLVSADKLLEGAAIPPNGTLVLQQVDDGSQPPAWWAKSAPMPWPPRHRCWPVSCLNSRQAASPSLHTSPWRWNFRFTPDGAT